MYNPPRHEHERSAGDDTRAENPALEGWVPDLGTPGKLRDAVEKAFAWRGDITLTLRSGETLQGYVFDRGAASDSIEDCYLRLMPADGGGKIRVPYGEIAAIVFSGKDAAAGKSYEAWLKKYRQLKSADAKNTGGESETPE